jgi:hypothetical protein
MSEAAPSKPRMSDLESLRRGLVKVSFNDTHKALHGSAVAQAMLTDIRGFCARAIAEKWFIDPAGLAAFIDDNVAQLDPATAQKVEG